MKECGEKLTRPSLVRSTQLEPVFQQPPVGIVCMLYFWRSMSRLTSHHGQMLLHLFRLLAVSALEEDQTSSTLI